jgi:outer membrane protein with beta-barrel domain
VRKLSAILFVLCLFGAVGVAQIPTSGNIYFGYSLNHGSFDPLLSDGTLHGWEASAEVRMVPHIGLVGDIAQQFGTVNGIDMRSEQYLFGPRASFRVGPVRPFVHFTIGAAHVHEELGPIEDSDTSFAYAIGGGVDYRLLGPLNWRLQLESLNTNFFDDWQHNTRFSTGLAVHF